MNNQENEVEVPITVDFDDSKHIGTATIRLSESQLNMLANGKLTFSTEVISTLSSDIAVGVYTDIELMGISLVPTKNYINYLKKHGFYNDNDDNTNSIKG